MAKRFDTSVTHALVAFGANLPFDGDAPEVTLRHAAKALSDLGARVTVHSRIFRTPCFPAGAGPDYANAAAAVRIAPGMTPKTLLDILHQVEDRFGRMREARWGMRTLDIDLLAFGDSVLPDAATQDDWRALAPDRQIGATPDRLILPHPRLQDRAFVLVPLADVAADWVHPRTGLTVAQMRDALPQADRDAVKPL